MAQWINVHQNKCSFINPMRLPLWKNSGTIQLAQLGFMTGRQVGSQTKILHAVEILNFNF